jgi:hypothetical protein
VGQGLGGLGQGVGAGVGGLGQGLGSMGQYIPFALAGVAIFMVYNMSQGGRR